MKKPALKPRKLALAVETIRPLQPRDLAEVAGGSGATVCYRISVGFCD